MSSAETNDAGDIEVTEGKWIGERFRINRLLGEGIFGKVVDCYDSEDPEVNKAVKVVKQDEHYFRCAENEILCMNKIKRAQDFVRECFAELICDFVYEGHVCLVMPVYGRNLYEFLSDNLFRGLNLHHTQKMCHQLLLAGDYLHKCGLVHTDIKPENVLIKNDKWMESRDIHGTFQLLFDPSIVLSDFNTVRNSDCNEETIQTINYRAPEVILELPWNEKVDVWSIGCVFVDIFLGITIFCAPTNGTTLQEKAVQLNNICTYCGPVPYHMIKQTTFSIEFGEYYMSLFPTDETNFLGNPHMRIKEFRPLIRLIKRLLTIDPYFRLTCAEALESPFFDNINRSLGLFEKYDDDDDEINNNTDSDNAPLEEPSHSSDELNSQLEIDSCSQGSEEY